LKSSKHLDALFTDPHLEAQRITMHTHISRLMDPFSAEMEATNKNLREQVRGSMGGKEGDAC
jgi:hypothetical protein